MSRIEGKGMNVLNFGAVLGELRELGGLYSDPQGRKRERGFLVSIRCERGLLYLGSVLLSASSKKYST